ncbi:PPOX class probable F420-dependent enzyme [Ferrithrix thermotolerans DSM 19514]|uniref:PPOX class probable F420-dependent enzyme n=1 Tax=Ferrithrix thermotolerans DSM 19514 TaxID=1121881 RepID=A0A1M4VTS9_9ACTN|nr:PPOX class F420-dependent oxidoreductase [Ferrithrix thermotolerans]SHE72213.1 PPOX class probable F420-dependent enzyme [Ferrithrix thermotolerans DSM 19514]
MPSRRDLIKMSESEVLQFLHGARTMSLATISASGQPHLVAMWFIVNENRLEFWTFAKSQKAVNLRRDPRATVLIESGETYSELRGVEIAGTCELLDELGEVDRIGTALFRRYMGDDASSLQREQFLASAPKRLGFRLHPSRVVSWDHTKLQGIY